MLPFLYIPRIIIVHLVKAVVFWLNSFPSRNGGTSKIRSPQYIMTGHELNYQCHMRTAFGEYVQAHEEHTNGMEERSTGAICLGPTINVNGSHYFMCVKTGAKLTRTQWTDMPMPDEVIYWVSRMGRKQEMPRTLTFGDRHGKEIKDRLAGGYRR